MTHADNNYLSGNLFAKLESNGFTVKGKYIYKNSSGRNNLLKVVGQINQSNFFFYSENVHPFKSGANFFNENTFGNNKEVFNKYYVEVTEKQRNDFNVSYENYIKSTKETSVFSEWLNKAKREKVNTLIKNYFDVRGVSSGYLEDAAIFPIFDFDNNFITAQIIKYGSDGKRIKSQFSTNWFHSYKPIKADLGFKDTDSFSVSVPYFFGENQLNGSDNIVAIVEAPKTAVILKEIYPNIDWIATLGEGNLSNKNLDLLKDRNVILFPDAHTTAWAKFAGEKGFYCSDILEKESIDAGADLADFIFDTESKIFTDLHELLFSLNIGEFDFNINADSLIFDYKVAGEDKSYFIAVPTYYKGSKVLNQYDNSCMFDVCFKGNKFDLYSEKYEIYLSQIDWHRQILKDGVLRPPTEQEFIFNLQQCFRILKELNPKIYIGVFEQVVKKLRSSNFSFNEKYVLQRLVPFWDNWNRDLDVFVKWRNWRYKGGESLSREEFVTELNNHRFQYKFKLRMENLYDMLSENRFIDIETDLGIKNELGYSKIKEIIKSWNENVIGCKTFKSYLKKIDFIDKINLGTKNHAVHIKNTIYSAYTFVPKLKYSEITEITGIKNKATIKSFLQFIPDEEIKENVFDEVYHIKENANNIVPIRQRIGDTQRIYSFELSEPKQVGFNILELDTTKVEILLESLLEKAFGTIKQLSKIDSSKLSEGNLEFHNYELGYLNFLEKLNNYTVLGRLDILNDLKSRLVLINTIIYKQENKILKNPKKALKLAF